MTEREWFAEYDFGEFLNACEWLRDDKKNKRKLLLWGCACCRRLGDLLGDKRSWQAIEAAERKADGLAGKDELNEAREAAKRVPRIRQKLQGTAAEFAASAPVFLLNPSAAEFSQTAAIRAALAMEKNEGTTQDAELKVHYQLLHDIFGNPVRKAKFDKRWRTSTVVALARQMYDSRDFSTMPILGDALQDAGCDSEEILAHCRGEGAHVRGCWVVDLVLGKE